MGIARDDSERRQDWVLRGFRQFDAPVCVIVTYDRVLDGSDDTPFDCGAVTNALVNAATPVTITGLAKDNIGIRQVQVSLDDGTTFADAVLATPGTPSTLYSFRMSPVTGINTIKVKATVFKGNVSILVTHVYTQLRTLTVGIEGPANSGAVTAGFSPASSRQVGKSLSITATPKTGCVFNGWTVSNTAGTGITTAKHELRSCRFLKGDRGRPRLRSSSAT